MKYLLDTCTLLWLVNGDARLSPVATRLCADPENQLHVSVVSAWEVGIKSARGKLLLPLEPKTWWKQSMEQHDLQELPVTSAIGFVAAALDPIHNDPFDRVLVATAAEYGLTMLSPGPEISRYRNIGVVW